MKIRPAYRVTVLHKGEQVGDRPAADWTSVRKEVGDMVEQVMAGLDDNATEDATMMDLPALNRALTDPQTQRTVDTSGAWRGALPMARASVTITRLLEGQ